MLFGPLVLGSEGIGFHSVYRPGREKLSLWKSAGFGRASVLVRMWTLDPCAYSRAIARSREIAPEPLINMTIASAIARR